MPIFEYRCKACDHLFEKLVSRHDSQVDCPACASTEVTKLLSTFAAQGKTPDPTCVTGNCVPTKGCMGSSGFS